MNDREVSPSEIALDAARRVSALGEYRVRGRVRKSSRTGQGIVYAVLCDESGAELRCRWKGESAPEAGSIITVVGTPTIYAASSELQFQVTSVEDGR